MGTLHIIEAMILPFGRWESSDSPCGQSESVVKLAVTI